MIERYVGSIKPPEMSKIMLQKAQSNALRLFFFLIQPIAQASSIYYAMNSNEEQKILTSVNRESFLHEWGLKWEGKCKIVSFYHCLFVWLLSLAWQPYNHVVSLLSLSVQFHFNSGPLLAWETCLQCHSKGDIKQTKMYIQLKIYYMCKQKIWERNNNKNKKLCVHCTKIYYNVLWTVVQYCRIYI